MHSFLCARHIRVLRLVHRQHIYFAPVARLCSFVYSYFLAHFFLEKVLILHLMHVLEASDVSVLECAVHLFVCMMHFVHVCWIYRIHVPDTCACTYLSVSDEGPQSERRLWGTVRRLLHRRLSDFHCLRSCSRPLVSQNKSSQRLCLSAFSLICVFFFSTRM